MKPQLIALAVVWLVVLPLTTACSVHYGSPQAVWFWCTMLRWCQP